MTMQPEPSTFVSDVDRKWMELAISEARRGKGYVEPNPMVGCVVVDDGKLIGSGFHQKFGTHHAEVNALLPLMDRDLSTATLYVTLEPCSHYGKTPPCVDLVLKKRPARVVVAMQDPYSEVSGRGIEKLRSAGIQVSVGILESESRQLNAPYLKLIAENRPWVIGKWAMSLDGSIATRTGDSKWISNESSRSQVHRIRSEVDAIISGIGTVLADDPMLNARLAPGVAKPRIAKRVILDRKLRIPLESKLVLTAREISVTVVTSCDSDPKKWAALESLGVTVWGVPVDTIENSLEWTLERLGAERCTNVLLEAGATFMGSAMDLGLVDQVECFIAPKIIGGQSLRPILGTGVERVADASQWITRSVVPLDGDVWISLINRNAQ